MEATIFASADAIRRGAEIGGGSVTTAGVGGATSGVTGPVGLARDAP
jgi:hypothetical protein